MNENGNSSSIIGDSLKNISHGDLRRRIMMTPEGDFIIVEAEDNGETEDETLQDVSPFAGEGFA